MKGVGLFIDAAMPFTKTPANIAVSGLQYSPIGLANGLIKVLSNNNPSMAIETLSKGLTGTGLMMAGSLLASLGLARGGYDKEDEPIMQLQGRLPNSITLPNGSYTMDWAQPLSIPFFMGVALYESLNKSKDLGVLEASLKALYAGGDTLIDQSMLRGVKELFDTSYGKSITENIAKLPISYATQTFPTLLGQTARAIDPYKRQIDYSTDAKAIGTGLLAKTPGLSMLLPKKLDILGQPMKYGEGVGNMLAQYLSPGYIGKAQDTPLTKELVRLYGVVGKDMMPKYNTSKFDYKSETINLDNKERSKFQETMGKYTQENLESYIQSRDYKDKTDEEKAAHIKKVNEKGYNLAKEEVIENRK
jgi:hypothetical protein